MRKILLVFITSAFVFPAWSAPKKVVGRKVKPGSTSRFAAEGLKLRKTRRAAIGTKVGGSQGLIGANIELNFSPRIGFMAGYGGGKGFQSYSFEIKQYIGGDSFLPYLSTGYAHWWGRERDGGLTESRPKFLVERFLNEAEIVSGKFAVNMFYPGLGVQFVKLDGEYAGFSMFGEVVMMIELADFKSAPTGSLGFMYYF